MFAVKRQIVLYIAVCWLFSCAGAPSAKEKGETPLWVYDREKAYPDGEWLAVVEQAKTREAAVSAALDSLARVFSTDVQGVSNAYQEFTQTVAGKAIDVSDETLDFAQKITTTSNVSGLIGVTTSDYKANDGVFWALAKLNRAETAAIYSKTVKNNEKIIDNLLKDAKKAEGSFEAYSNIRFAIIVGEVTDDIQKKLAVVDKSTASAGLSYGSTSNLQALLTSASRAIMVNVDVKGDENSRISKALSEAMTRRGFRTGKEGNYKLKTEFSIEPVDIKNDKGYIYLRYILKAALTGKNGKEIFVFSGNAREGHLNSAEVRQRTIRAAESSISDGEFDAAFEEFLNSLI